MPDPRRVPSVPRPSRCFPLLAPALAALLAAGCAGERTADTVHLSTADFIGPAPAPAASVQAGVPEPVAAPAALPAPAGAAAVPLVTLGAGSTDIEPLPAAVAAEGIVDVSAAAGPPRLAPGSVAPARSAVLVDAIVGSVNGKPVRANDLLGPMEARLRAKAAERNITRDEWLKFASREINRELQTFVEDELLRAEAMSTLKPMERMGLQHFLNEWREDLRRQNRGSRALVAERLAEEEGMTEAEWLRGREDAALIQHQLQNRVNNRVHVSWQDVKLYYERHFDEFNPPPTATFRLIAVRADNPEGVDAVRSALASGAPFAEAAALPANFFNPDEAGLRTLAVPDGIENAKVFDPAELNAAARALKPGESTPEPIPFSDGSLLGWIAFESLTENGRPLEDREVQLSIIRVLTLQRQEAEHIRYVAGLLERASATDMNQMKARLMQIATARCLPPGLQ